MRAWQVHGAGEPRDVARIVDAPLPDPGPGQLRVKVTAAGIGLPDVFMCRGTYPLTPRGGAFTPGQEVAGVVTAVGEGVDGTRLGDRVMGVTMFYAGHGSFAEECLVTTDNVRPIPTALTDTQAAGFWIPHLTAWSALVDRGGLRTGETVAVLGASGGSGIAAVQLAKALDARVIAVAGGDRKTEFCTALGADHTIDHRTGPIGPQLKELTGGRGVDLIVDPVGGEAAEDAVRGLARGGRMLLVGFASGRWPTIAPHLLVATNTSLVGVIAAGYRTEELDDIHRRLSELVATGRLRNAITREIPFEGLGEALQDMAERSVVGKQVMVW